MRRLKIGAAGVLAISLIHFPAYANSSGSEGAAFLDIPVGADPAALGAAYTALATDAYAPTINPAGLGFVDSTQISAQYLSYLESMNYEYFSAVHPFGNGRALGASIQYLGSGDINGTDQTGASIGSFSSHYAAYNLAYGQTLTDKLSLGGTVKLINASIDDVSANAYAVDMGAMYKMRENLMLAASLMNLGTQLKFISEGDSLPLAFHTAAAYDINHQFKVVSELVFPQTGLISAHFGGEWRPIDSIVIRTGYRTDTTKELSALAGFTTGIGLSVWGQEFAYAWVPYGDLGNTNYFSLIIRFGEAEREKKNLIQYQNIKQHRAADYNYKSGDKQDQAPEYQQLMELLNDSETRAAKAPSTQPGADGQ